MTAALAVPAMAIGGHAAMSGMNAFARMGVASSGAGAVALVRFSVAAMILWLVWRHRGGRLPARGTLRIHAVRGGLICIGAVCYFQGMAILPLAQATALTFLAPIIAQPLGAMRLGERPGARETAALALGALGVTIASCTAFSSGHTAPTGVAWMATGVAATALHMVLLRERAGTDGALTTAMLASALPAVASLPFAADLSWDALPTSIAAGVLGATGMTLSAGAAARGRLAQTSVYEFSKLPLAILLGWATAGEVPDATTVVGGAFALSACMALKAGGIRRVGAAPARVHA